jgi:hypothetical protein
VPVVLKPHLKTSAYIILIYICAVLYLLIADAGIKEKGAVLLYSASKT